MTGFEMVNFGQLLQTACCDSPDLGAQVDDTEGHDITCSFLVACSRMCDCAGETVLPADLAVGELAMDSSFQLAEAMSAIELMDPKMDIGMQRVPHATSFVHAIAVRHCNGDVCVCVPRVAAFT
jgi:hypothetical protein